MTKFIVEVEKMNPSEALAILMAKRADLDTCKPGWGWTIRLDDQRAFCRRTKSGYSIKEQRP